MSRSMIDDQHMKPPEPLKIRRSMADYIQRKRKLREQEAAKEVHSPVVEAAPLRPQWSPTSPDSDTPSLTNNSAMSDGDQRPAATSRGLNDKMPPERFLRSSHPSHLRLCCMTS